MTVVFGVVARSSREIKTRWAAVTQQEEVRVRRDTVFVPLDGGPGDGVALAAATELAGKLDARVRAQFFGGDDAALMIAAGANVGGVSTGLIEAARDAKNDAHTRADAAAKDHDVAVEPPALTRAGASASARLSSFAVMDPAAGRGEGPLRDVFDAFLFDDGLPVVLPRPSVALGHVAIAWDGSREAARSLKAARMLVAAADRVSVLQAPAAVDARDREASNPDAVVGWLADRGVSAEVTLIDDATQAAPSLMSVCATADVDLLITGAYGHARLREVVFGGVTRALLRADSPSLFLAH